MAKYNKLIMNTDHEFSCYIRFIKFVKYSSMLVISGLILFSIHYLTLFEAIYVKLLRFVIYGQVCNEMIMIDNNNKLYTVECNDKTNYNQWYLLYDINGNYTMDRSVFVKYTEIKTLSLSIAGILLFILNLKFYSYYILKCIRNKRNRARENRRNAIHPVRIDITEFLEVKIESKTPDPMEFANMFDVMCVICQENIAINDSQITNHFCGNKFHNVCINNWMKHNITCPICRSSLI